MKTKTIELFTFDELPEEIQKKVIEKNYGINVDYEWWDCTYEDFHTMANYFGIDVDLKKTYFTGFSHQGQGSAFTSKSVDVLKLIACIEGEKWKEHAPKETLQFYKVTQNIKRVCKLIYEGHIDFSAWVETSNRETSVKVQTEWGFDNPECNKANLIKAIEELEELITDACKTLNHWLFNNLEKESEYLTSKEAIVETIKANEYTFRANGDIEN